MSRVTVRILALTLRCKQEPSCLLLLWAGGFVSSHLANPPAFYLNNTTGELLLIAIATQPDSEPMDLADAKAWLRVDHNEEDQSINILISAARRWCENYLHRKIITTAVRQTVRKFPPTRITLEASPLVYVDATSLVVTYVDELGSPQTFDNLSYVVAYDYDPAFVLLREGYSWPSIQSRSAHPIQLAYSVGYGSAPEDVPACIKEAMLLLIGHYFVNRQDVVTGTISTQVNNAASALLDCEKMAVYR